MTSEKDWDEWFTLTNDEESLRAWHAAKHHSHGSPIILDKWATIIELNRIDKILHEKDGHK